MLISEYSGGKIKYGHLIGLVDENRNIDMRYHQVNEKGKLMTGICKSKPEILENKKSSRQGRFSPSLSQNRT